MRHEQVYTEHETVWMPDTRITEPLSRYTYQPLRGYGSILAVFDDGKCIGFILSETLGYPTVKDWMKGSK
jgi:hypothetical protein